MPVIGWDIGGVNTKVTRVQNGTVIAAHSHPFEIQRDPSALAPLLTSLARHIDAAAHDAHAVTMTAELSQMFRTKRDGVAFVLDAVAAAFPRADVRIYTVDGRFLLPADARREPLAVAASNWAAIARVVALDHANAILIDIGTTTTDIIPVIENQVVTNGTTDPARLASGELVYTGALRTPVEAIVRHVPLGDALAGVSAEGFALIGDVHLWRGDLAIDDYSVPTPDSRPVSREFAGERIARIVCGDREILDSHAISRIADSIAAAQIDQVARAITRVRDRHPALHTAVVTGLGVFVATCAARQAGLTVIPLAESIGDAGARCAPAAAVGLLLERELASRRGHADPASVTPNGRPGVVDIVVKVGGGLLSHPDRLRSALTTVVDAAHDARIAIVPGGGPFADAIRAADRSVSLSDDAAHWMAVLAMDQYAHLLASLHPSLDLVSSVDEIRETLAAVRVPVIAPYRWLRDTDPLPHAWDVTSDSISAWIAGELHAEHLVLVKPPAASGDSLVDRYFVTALPPDVTWVAVPGDRLDELRAELRLHVRR